MTRKLNEKALNYCLKLLRARLRSRQELKDKLLLRGYEQPDIEAALNYLEDSGDVNDRRFAECWINDRLKFNPRGPFVLLAELKKKGIDRGIIDKAMLSAAKGNDFSKLAFELAGRKLRKLRHDVGTNEAKRKIFDHLNRRGFEVSLIYNIIGELFK